MADNWEPPTQGDFGVNLNNQDFDDENLFGDINFDASAMDVDKPGGELPEVTNTLDQSEIIIDPQILDMSQSTEMNPLEKVDQWNAGPLDLDLSNLDTNPELQLAAPQPVYAQNQFDASQALIGTTGNDINISNYPDPDPQILMDMGGFDPQCLNQPAQTTYQASQICNPTPEASIDTMSMNQSQQPSVAYHNQGNAGGVQYYNNQLALALPGPPPVSASAPATHIPSTGFPSPSIYPATIGPSRLQTPALSVLDMPDDEPETLERIPRKGKGRDVDYSKYYEALPKTPTPFINDFIYSRSGEWKGHLVFSHQQLTQYMQSRKQQNLPLRIWIQNAPAGCTKRGGPDERTRKCRYDDCPSKNHTILKGFWRVAFDERPMTSGTTTDPFMNAGYMHLWCFERCFDLVGMIAQYDIKPDTRRFSKEDRNPMALDRDHPEIIKTYVEWKRAQATAWKQWQLDLQTRQAQGMNVGRNRRHRERQDYLWSVLTEQHLALESSARQSTRDQRGGNSIDKHRGDLSLYVKLTEQRRIANKKKKERYDEWEQSHKSPPNSPLRRSPRTLGKRGRDDEAEDEITVAPSPKRRQVERPTNISVGAGSRANDGEPGSPLRRSPRIARQSRARDEPRDRTDSTVAIEDYNMDPTLVHALENAKKPCPKIDPAQRQNRERRSF